MNEPRLDTTRLQHFARAYTRSAALFAAIDLKLFTHINRGVFETADLAATLGISELNVERLVTVCLAMDLVRRENDRLLNAPDVNRYLVKGKKTYAAAWMTFTRPGVPQWLELTELLRNQEPAARLGIDFDMTVDEARRYHEATYSVGMGAGRLFCRQVDLSGRRKMLDLGGGSGAYCINAAKAFDGLEAIVFDLPAVTEVAREHIAENGISDRVGTIAGDFTSDPFPRGCDVVLMASNLPMYNEETIGLVVRKAFEALEPGGEMHLVGEMLDADGVGPLDAALWGLQEVLRNSEGKAHTVGQVRGYFTAAGFETVEDRDFVPGVLRRVWGRKPV
jgi:SAM-dependent methyltransferase